MPFRHYHLFNAHINNTNVHMTYEEKVERFLTRREFNLYNANIKKQLDRIEDHLESIDLYLQGKK